MGYVEKQLADDERVIFFTRLHWITLVAPMLFALVIFMTSVSLFTADDTTGAGTVSLLLAASIAGWGWLRFISSEFAVTDRRVIIKVGFISRRTIETLLTKVEGVHVDQSILGRMLDYGTIRVVGTGGTGGDFKAIAEPLALRQHVQEGASRGHASAAHHHLAAMGARPGGGTSSVDQLERLAKLRDVGAITSAEFESEKRKILA